MTSKLSRVELGGLETISWAMRHFDAASTGRGFLRRTAKRLEAKGLIKSAGLCTPCDGDGGTIHTRQEREGWKLTEEGRKALKAGGWVE